MESVKTVKLQDSERESYSPILWITAFSVVSSSFSLMKNNNTSISNNTQLSCDLTLLIPWPLTSACPHPGCWWCHSSAGWLTAGSTSADAPDVCRRSSSPALRITHTFTISYKLLTCSTQISSYTANPLWCSSEIKAEFTLISIKSHQHKHIHMYKHDLLRFCSPGLLKRRLISNSTSACWSSRRCCFTLKTHTHTHVTCYTHIILLNMWCICEVCCVYSHVHQLCVSAH